MKDGTKSVALGEIVDLVMGQAPSSKDTNFDRAGIPFVKVGEFGNERPIIREWTTNPLRMARRTDVLLCVVGATCGKINLGDECAIGRSVAAIRPHPSKLKQFYLYYFMMTLVERLRSGSVGAAQTVISKEMVETVQIPLPSLAEQQRIVGVLEEAFAGLATAQATAERNLQNARALFESHLKSAFARRGHGWVETTVGEVCLLKSGTTVAPSLERPAGDIPYLKVADMTIDGNADVITTSSRFLNKANIKESAIIPRGATIFPKRGGAILTNKKRITSGPICADLNIMAVIPSPRIDPLLLYFYFLNIDMKQLGTGSSIPQINNYDISPLPIAFPRKVGEQHDIAERFQSLRTETQRLKAVYQRKLTALYALKESLLHQAFTGAL